MNECLGDVKQTKHPFKTYIGRIRDDGFDFLGYRIGIVTEQNSGSKLGLAWKSWANHFDRLRLLYERGVSVGDIAGYVKRWLVWVKGGVEIDLRWVVEVGLGSGVAKELGLVMGIDFGLVYGVLV